ncbi:hypothetical protein nbrc107697_20580 [Gordonia crocea]|uniref:Uncharacterized protein n=1 Tax=Gordonia crocea TaxID=589162 RepID=A0A7I9UYN2_9ACTN|nr:hypothetical protein nbrc107697_20580 [Gordonia crocea]
MSQVSHSPNSPEEAQEGRGRTIAYAALGLLFTLALSTSIWAQGQSEERAYVYIGRAMAATYLAVIVLAWAKQPFPRVVPPSSPGSP